MLLTTLAVTGLVYQAVATRNDRQEFPPPGRLVAVDGYQLHIHCTGEGSPTVILDAMGGNASPSWGHSAGASHIAGCLAGQAGTIPTEIRAAILLSGIYDVPAAMEFDKLRPMTQTYFGTDEGRYPAMSTVSGVAASPIPTLIGIAELDPPPMHGTSLAPNDTAVSA